VVPSETTVFFSVTECKFW